MLFQVTRRCAEQEIVFPDVSSSRAHFRQETQRLAIFDSENRRTFWDRSSTNRISTENVRQLTVGLIALQGVGLVLGSLACNAGHCDKCGKQLPKGPIRERRSSIAGSIFTSSWTSTFSIVKAAVSWSYRLSALST